MTAEPLGAESTRAAAMPEATRAAGLARLADFVPRAGRAYAAERNADHGPGDRSNVSTLSPWVRHRLVTEREIVAVVLERHSLSAASTFVQEVYWRTYWKGWLERRPTVWTRYTASVAPTLEALSATERATYDDAVAGRTGIDGFDQWARELVETGYLHNHARMWFASIWIFTLRLPWQLGADFFLRHLLDGDPASNTLSWRWVAGLQTVGKTYLATADNIARCTDGRFRPRGLATTAHAIDDDAPVPLAGPAPVPAPLPRVTRVALLLHEDDLHAESLPTLPSEVTLLGVAAPAVGEPRSPLAATAEAPARFTAAALADGLARAAAHHGAGGASGMAATAVPAEHLAHLHPDTVLAWLRGLGAEALLTPHAPVGPTRDRLDALEAALRAEGIPLHRQLRGWDARAWPHAHRGFFPFKERIPALLREEQIVH